MNLLHACPLSFMLVNLHVIIIICILCNHLSLITVSQDERYGHRFVSMSKPYDKNLRGFVSAVCKGS